MSKEKFYITTPAYYPNDVAHLGHAYTTIAADVIARWERLRGKDVMFISGLDEHGSKIESAARGKGMDPQRFVNMMAEKFKNTWRTLKISYDDFIRTSEEKHIKAVIDIFRKIYKAGDIYKGIYEDWYCIPCESYWTETQLVNRKCPECRRNVEKLKEESYFFSLNKYQNKLLELYEKYPEFISPLHRRKEIINRVKAGLKDLSISRTNVKWGIPVPIDNKSTLYVWIDALTFYLSVLGYPDKKFKRFWPADLHLMAKEILWFHAVIWPAMLMSAGLEVPKKVFAHGWLTVNGEKMSKSKGNFIIPEDMVKKYSLDAFRYFLLREIPFGEDGDFSEEALVTRNNDELANTLGNLVHRILSFIYSKNRGLIPEPGEYDILDKKLKLKIETTVERAGVLLEELQLHKSLEEIISLAKSGNEYFQAKEPWKGDFRSCLYLGANLVRSLAILLSPFIPESSERILGYLNTGPGSWESAGELAIKPGHRIRKPEPLFRKLEAEEAPQERKGLKLMVDEGCLDLGIKVRGALIYGLQVKKKKGSLERLKKGQVKGMKIDQERINGYLDIYKRLGLQDIGHPIQRMHEIAKGTGKLPTINTVVDSYNMVAVRESLSMGAHDLDKIEGDVVFKITDGSESYTPLGGTETKKANRGEYACADSGGRRVICRLDIKQSEDTKMTPGTRNIFLYVQGNPRIPDSLLEKVLREVCRNIRRFCGGECVILG